MPHNMVQLMHELGPEFAARAARCDGEDLFVAENYVALKQRSVLTAGIPKELGGSGVEFRELSEMLRILAHYCGSTALALSMHTHQVAIAVWRWRRDPLPPETLLRKVVSDELVLVSSGGSDWIAGSGKAEPPRAAGTSARARSLPAGFRSATSSSPVPCGRPHRTALRCCIFRFH
jgi:alkylation response protein AidB-like acyl-CoA dehydrogenase